MFIQAYQQCTQHLTSIYSKSLLTQIQTELSSKLPILNEREKHKRSTLTTDKSKSSFYSSLRQKYSNFLELQYLTDDLLHSLYDLSSSWQDHKHSLTNSKFKYNLFLHKLTDRSVPISFPQSLHEQFLSKKSKALLTSPNSFWLNAAFNCKNEHISNFIKYHKQLASRTDSVIITVGLIYENIADDIFALLARNSHIRRVVLKVEQKAFWVGESIEQMPFYEDTEWFNEMNMIMNVVFGCLYKMERLVAVSVVCDIKCNFLLFRENCEILERVVRKHKATLEVVTFSRVELDQVSQWSIVKAVAECKEMKVVMFKSAKFKEDVCRKAMDDFQEERFQEMFVYFRLNKEWIIVNNVYEEIKEK